MVPLDKLKLVTTGNLIVASWHKCVLNMSTSMASVLEQQIHGSMQIKWACSILWNWSHYTPTYREASVTSQTSFYFLLVVYEPG